MIDFVHGSVLIPGWRLRPSITSHRIIGVPLGNSDRRGRLALVRRDLPRQLVSDTGIRQDRSPTAHVQPFVASHQLRYRRKCDWLRVSDLRLPRCLTGKLALPVALACRHDFGGVFLAVR
jgi:hypothetical protein